MNAAGASVKFMVFLPLSKNVDNGTNVGIREQQQGRLVAHLGHPAMSAFPPLSAGMEEGSIPDVDEAERSSTRSNDAEQANLVVLVHDGQSVGA